MYCDLIEAFDTPLGRQIEEYENNMNRFMYYTPQGSLNMERVDESDNNFNLGHKGGASMPGKDMESFEDTKSEYFTDDASTLSVNSDYTNLSSFDDNKHKEHFSYKKKKKKLTHEEYLRVLVADLKGLEITGSSDAYEHLKYCQFCKDELKLRVLRTPDDIKNLSKEDNKIDRFERIEEYTDTQRKLGFAFILGLCIIVLLELVYRYVKREK